MTNSLSIDEIERLKIDTEHFRVENCRLKNRVKKLKTECESKNQMLMDAHFQNKKLADELITTQSQYNQVVEQNRDYNMRNMELEEKFKTVLNIAKTCDMPSCLNVDCNCDICHDEITEYGKRCMQKGLREILKTLTPPNDVQK